MHESAQLECQVVPGTSPWAVSVWRHVTGQWLRGWQRESERSQVQSRHWQTGIKPVAVGQCLVAVESVRELRRSKQKLIPVLSQAIRYKGKSLTTPCAGVGLIRSAQF